MPSAIGYERNITETKYPTHHTKSSKLPSGSILVDGRDGLQLVVRLFGVSRTDYSRKGEDETNCEIALLQEKIMHHAKEEVTRGTGGRIGPVEVREVKNAASSASQTVREVAAPGVTVDLSEGWEEEPRGSSWLLRS